MLNIDSSSGKFFAQSNGDDNTEFVNRQKSVFEKLDAVVQDKEKESQHSSAVQSLSVETKSRKRQRCDTRQFRGQESIFLRPEAPPPSRFKRSIPDYVKHPQKWTKYTLSDVSQEDMSDRSNTAAAMTFLQELRAKKESELMDSDSDIHEITFKKPSSYRNRETKTGDKPTDKIESPIFRSSKVVLPEYVVGEKKASKKNSFKQNDKTEKSKEIKLDHLNEEDDEF